MLKLKAIPSLALSCALLVMPGMTYANSDIGFESIGQVLEHSVVRAKSKQRTKNRNCKCNNQTYGT